MSGFPADSKGNSIPGSISPGPNRIITLYRGAVRFRSLGSHIAGSNINVSPFEMAVFTVSHEGNHYATKSIDDDAGEAAANVAGRKLLDLCRRGDDA